MLTTCWCSIIQPASCNQLHLQSLMEFGVAAAGETTKSGIVHFERELGYLLYFKRNIKNLKIKIEQLTAARNDVQGLVDADMNNNGLIRETVEIWLARAKVVIDEAVQVYDEAKKINNFLKGWLTLSRFLLGRRADKKMRVIQGLLDDRTAFGDTVSTTKPAQNLDLISSTDFETFASRKSTAKSVIEALKDEEISLFGVFGMPGVGKTTLIKSVSKYVKSKERLFEQVVMVTVSQNPDIKIIQSELGSELDLKLDKEESVALRAKRLSARLKQVKKILIVLDDLWERLDLHEVGIPFGDDHKDCKVVITTRDQDVCNTMETQRKIGVALLSEQDSWRLFQDKAGDVKESSLQTVARQIVDECKGLPLAIVTLGRALRDKEKVVWLDALQQLKKSIFGGMTPVVSSVRLSYNFLHNETIKMCFLFCCLFPEDFKIPISILRSYILGEKLFRNTDTLEEANGRLHSIIDKLISSCLLVRVDERCVTMHDVVRDVAIQIASEESNGFIVKAGMRLTEWPHMELHKCKRISLMSNSIRYGIPHRIQAPLLLTLSLNGNQFLHEIPPDLFREMRSLLILDLSRTRISSLPPSLSCLVNLRSLLLEDCWNLTNISPVEKLERLEILDLYGSEILNLPEEIGSSGCLKMVNLSQTPKLDIISPNVVSSLSRLEELHMATSFRKWAIEGVGDGITAKLSEIASLKHLTSLDLSIGNLELLSQNLSNQWDRLVKFKILLGSTSSSHFDSKSRQYDRSLFVEIPSVSLANWVKVLLERTNHLCMHRCEGLESVGILDPRGLNNNCKSLHVRKCPTMRYLMNTTEVKNVPIYAFSALEDLAFVELDNFMRICHGTVPEGFLYNLRQLQLYECNRVPTLIQFDLLSRLQNLEILTVNRCQGLNNLIEYNNATPETPAASSSSTTIVSKNNFSNLPPSPIFPSLRQLDIVGCDKLKYIFPIRVVRDLLLLEEIYIANCSSLETIVANDSEEDDFDAVKDNEVLPRLRHLVLINLPSLSSFSRPGSPFALCALEELRVKECEKLRRFPIAAPSLPKLRILDVDRDWLHRLQWLDQSLKKQLQTLLPVAEGLDSAATESSNIQIRQAQQTFRFQSQQWKDWAACSIQAAWAQYSSRKIMELRQGEVERSDEYVVNISSSSLAATIYSSRFASHTFRGVHRLRNIRSAGDLVKLQKPSEPDYTSVT